MPNAERYARDKVYYKEKNKEYREKYPEICKDICHRSYLKHQKERREAAHFEYLDNPQKNIDRVMKYYRLKNPVVKCIRIRKKGEKWPPKSCPTCGKIFIPPGNYPSKIYCSSLCFYKKKGYLNLQQYRNSTVTPELATDSEVKK